MSRLITEQALNRQLLNKHKQMDEWLHSLALESHWPGFQFLSSLYGPLLALYLLISPSVKGCRGLL